MNRVKCYFHPDIDAVGICSGCGKGLCSVCEVSEPDGKLYCKHHAEAYEKRRRRAILFIFVLLAAIIVILVAVVLLLRYGKPGAYTAVNMTSSTTTVSSTSTTMIPPTINYVAQFNGNSHLELQGYAPFNNEPDWTWSGWVYIRKDNPNRFFYSEGNPAITLSIRFSGGDRLNASLWNSGLQNLWTFGVLPGRTFAQDQWYLITITMHNGKVGSGTLQFYVNGTLAGSASGQMEHTNGDLAYIGDSVVPNMGMIGKSTGFSGYIADVQLYNRTLNGSQIYTLYSGGLAAKPVSSDGLMAWWPLNGTGRDYSGNGRDLQGYGVNYTGYLQVTR